MLITRLFTAFSLYPSHAPPLRLHCRIILDATPGRVPSTYSFVISIKEAIRIFIPRWNYGNPGNLYRRRVYEEDV